MEFKIKTAVKPIIGLNILFFILQMVIPTFTESFMLIGADIFTRPWILFTSMFLHGSPFHLIFNMYVLFLFGTLIEHKIGAKRFLFIYLLSGLLAAFVSSFFYSRALGASGAIYGIIGMVIILIPHLKVMILFLPIPMDLWKALLLFMFLDIFVFSHVAVIAHVVGCICGLLFGLYLRRQRKQYNKEFGSKTHMDVKDMEEYLKTGRI